MDSACVGQWHGLPKRETLIKEMYLSFDVSERGIIMAQTILYYPTINIQDSAWLRNAILYWDEVSSIVPDEGYSDLSPELLYLQKLGVYKAVYPQDLFFSEFAEDFCDAIVKRISTYDHSRERAIRNGVQNDRMMVHKRKIYAPALHELIHCRKLPPRILDYFGRKKYINDYNADGWMEIDSRIAQIYMKTLAEYSIKCSGKDIVLGTDRITHNREIYREFRKHAGLQTQCCKINIENCLPRPSMDVGFEDILAFKAKRKDELHAFRAKIRELETNIYHADSPELIRHYETQFIEEWQQCSQDFYKVLKDARIKFFLNSLVSLVAIPFVSQQLSSLIGQDLTPAIQTGAQFLAIRSGYFDYKDKISPAKADGAFSYIFNAKRAGIIHI